MLSRKVSSKFLVSDMDLHVQRMLTLIDEDADSFAKKAENYYHKRPELIALVEEFQRMYRTLADRCDTTDVRRPPLPSDLQSQASSCISDAGSELPSQMSSPDRRLGRRMSGGFRAPGFEVFLGFGGDHHDLDYYEHHLPPDDFPFKRPITELELEEELREVKEAQENNYESAGFDKKLVMRYQEELRAAKDRSDEANHLIMQLNNKSLANAVVEEGSFEDSEAEIVDPVMIKFEDDDQKQEVTRLRRMLTNKASYIRELQDQLKTSQEQVSFWKNEFKKKRQEVSRMHDLISHHEDAILDCDREIATLKQTLVFHVRNTEFMTELTKTLVMLQLQHDILVVEKADLNAYINQLAREVSFKDDQIDLMNQHLHKLQAEHIDLITTADGARRSANDLHSRVRELERDLERKQRIIIEEAEEKREAIRQLSVSLDHYRKGYHRLKQALMDNNGMPVIAS